MIPPYYDVTGSSPPPPLISFLPSSYLHSLLPSRNAPLGSSGVLPGVPMLAASKLHHAFALDRVTGPDLPDSAWPFMQKLAVQAVFAASFACEVAAEDRLGSRDLGELVLQSNDPIAQSLHGPFLVLLSLARLEE